MTTVEPAGKALNQACNVCVTSTEQSAAMVAGGLTLGPAGGARATAPPKMLATGGTVEVGGAVVVEVVVERCTGTEVDPFAPGMVGELEHAAATSATAASTSASRSPPRRRRGCTRSEAIVSASATDIGDKNMFEGCGVPPAQSTVRPATAGDIAQVARLHVEAIHEGFLSSLGPRFLRRLYARLARSSHGFLLVADGTSVGRPENVIGFVGGSTSLRAFSREFMRRDGLVAAVSSAPTLTRSLPRALETLRYGAGPEDGVPSEEESELLAIGVGPAARRRGTGASLTQAFLDASGRAGATSARVVVGAENDAAIALYERSGFCVAREFELHPGARSLLMRTDVPVPRA
jgi:ribosomal protein S18 acetylase RimI-like enzyme